MFNYQCSMFDVWFATAPPGTQSDAALSSFSRNCKDSDAKLFIIPNKSQWLIYTLTNTKLREQIQIRGAAGKEPEQLYWRGRPVGGRACARPPALDDDEGGCFANMALFSNYYSTILGQYNKMRNERFFTEDIKNALNCWTTNIRCIASEWKA